MSRLGVAATSYLSVWESCDTLDFLDRCHGFGAAGIHAPINGDPLAIRRRAEQCGMWFEAMVPLPQGEDTAAFEKSLQDAQTAGAVALRAACLGTRRYETFSDLTTWQQHVTWSHRGLATALPLLEKYRLPLGLENHKDWTTDELLDILQRYSSEYLGVCLDFGNNIALLDDPMDVFEKLAPFTVTTHFKNMAVQPYKDGFLLSEVPLGEGYLDLPRALRILTDARPKANLCLESITRDPLAIPCLTDRYWTTFPERSGLHLARTLRFVQHNTTHLPVAARYQSEDQNVQNDLIYARRHLDL